MAKTTPITTTQSPPKEKKVSAPKEKKVPAPKDEPKADDSVKEDSLTESSDVEDVLSGLMAKSAQYNISLTTATTAIAHLKTEHKILEKAWTKHLKTAIKAASKKRAKASSRKPSGFVKPALISTELATFLGKPDGHEMARTAATKEIDAYVLSNNLRDPKNGRIILADDKLLKLLNITKDVHLTYFNLQTYMKVHFKKADPITQTAPITA